jgi:hypothetical protein
MMKTKQTLLAAGALSAVMLAAPPANAQTAPPPAPNVPLIFTALGGNVRILQDVPCGDTVEIETTIAGGRMDITPHLPARGDQVFDLTRLDLFLTPFSVQVECMGISATAVFTEIGIKLLNSVIFTPDAVAGDVYGFTIPKEKFLLFQSVVDNAPAPQPETSVKQPLEDVTGEIDMGRKRVTLRVVLAWQLRFRAGCLNKNKCLIDEIGDGRQEGDLDAISHAPTRDVDGDGVPDLTDNCPLEPNASQDPVESPTITAPGDITLSSCRDDNIGEATAEDVCHNRPLLITNDAPATFSVGHNTVIWAATNGIDPAVTDAQIVTVVPGAESTPPTVSCTAVNPPGGSFRVVADDDCAPTIRLGSYELTSGEVIQLQRTGKAGVRLIETNRKTGIRHFQVGPEGATIVATDASGNEAEATCQ